MLSIMLLLTMSRAARGALRFYAEAFVVWNVVCIVLVVLVPKAGELWKLPPSGRG